MDERIPSESSQVIMLGRATLPTESGSLFQNVRTEPCYHAVPDQGGAVPDRTSSIVGDRSAVHLGDGLAVDVPDAAAGERLDDLQGARHRVVGDPALKE